jgi:hypothetical protein
MRILLAARAGETCEGLCWVERVPGLGVELVQRARHAAMPGCIAQHHKLH